MSKALTEGTRERLNELIIHLDLQPLEGESGLFSNTFISNISVQAPDEQSAVGNSIYYALTGEHPQNHLHWLFSDDHHVLIEGGPADYYIFHCDGQVEKLSLGRDIARGQNLLITTPGGSYKALQLHPTAEYVLVGSVNTPAWTPERVKVGANQEFIDKFAGKAEWATPDFLRGLIGPNWIEEDA